MLFKDLNIIKPILKALEEKWYESPTPIQEKAIPYILEGKDLLWAAQTWTGKTAAFAIPTIQLLSEKEPNRKVKREIKSLILTPTRELAIQIEENFTEYSQGLNIKNMVLFGWVKQHSQVRKLQSWVDILIATPGRLLDLMNQGYINLTHVEIFILDEADRMLDMWFINDVKRVLTKLPIKKQTLFFSATMPKEIDTLAETILKNPVKVEVTPISSTAEKIQQKVYFVSKPNKKNLLIEILKNEDIKSVLVFSRTKHWADKVVKDLEKVDISAQAIHWNKSQNARQRALNNFKSWETRVLLATDIAARGIDINELSYVINYDLSNEPETYVHRIWRTWRAGKNGLAISFCDQEEYFFLQDVQKLISKKIDVVTDHPYALDIDINAKPAKKKQNSRRWGGVWNRTREGWKRPAVANRKRDVRRNKNKR